MLLPLCIFIFLVPSSQNKKPQILQTTLLLGVLCLTIFSVFADVYDRNLAESFQQFTVAAGYGEVRGFFAASTDLGAIMGVVCFLFIWTFYQARKGGFTFYLFFLSLGAVIFYTGLLSESRNFFLFGLSALTTTGLMFIRQRPVIALNVFAVVLTTMALLPLVVPSDLAEELGKILPYISVISSGGVPGPWDFLPHITQSALGQERVMLWVGALDLIKEQPLLGVSNGGFRLSGVAEVRHNTHNIVLQALVDAGVLGLLILATLSVTICYRNRKNPWFLPLYVGLVATLMVDNFTDHSYAWMVVIAYSFSVISQKSTLVKKQAF